MKTAIKELKDKRNTCRQLIDKQTAMLDAIDTQLDTINSLTLEVSKQATAELKAELLLIKEMTKTTRSSNIFSLTKIEGDIELLTRLVNEA